MDTRTRSNDGTNAAFDLPACRPLVTPGSHALHPKPLDPMHRMGSSLWMRRIPYENKPFL